MSEPPPLPAPFWKLATTLWLASLAGAVLVLPYVLTLQQAALAAAVARTHMSAVQLLLISTVQTAVLLLIAVLAGLWASRRLGLAVPLVSAWLTRQPLPRDAGRTLLWAFAIGLAVGAVLILLDTFVFAHMPSVAGLVKSTPGGVGPGAWQGLLASFYGGIDEEILLRFGLMSVLALALRAVWRRRDADLPPAVFWIANILAALLFGLGHLPATAALVPLTAAVVLRAIVLNGVAGIVFGVLFRRYGLEWAMLSHFGADIVLHVIG
ncbi:CPBP family glutamic-type intramembrane protease [Bradyrhizobium erythrophlei]|uniref:CAAX protease self-immunity n=1 Tax=Bradyrhizobium erythrophlei TaxID=1437360 RepID=A0A1M7UX72_9BRAD|nr:CPBP family glutamic-type intramembrane protease [Bradyrhizobium erythrophlei]SHN87631.1 CAAX protease self-immunity [Bradyrhizobium erythrophlei]